LKRINMYVQQKLECTKNTLAITEHRKRKLITAQTRGLFRRRVLCIKKVGHKCFLVCMTHGKQLGEENMKQ